MESDACPILRFVPDGTPIDVAKNHVLVGRHAEADVMLAMPDISRRHCRFIRTEFGWRVVDLASTNGTFVNNVRVEEADLQTGDKVRIGSVTLEVAEQKVA